MPHINVLLYRGGPVDHKIVYTPDGLTIGARNRCHNVHNIGVTRTTHGLAVVAAAVAAGPAAQIISRDSIKLHATALGRFSEIRPLIGLQGHSGYQN